MVSFFFFFLAMYGNVWTKWRLELAERLSLSLHRPHHWMYKERGGGGMYSRKSKRWR